MSENNELSFVTVEALLEYGDALINSPRTEGTILPDPPVRSADPVSAVNSAKEEILCLLEKTQFTQLSAGDYRDHRQSIIDNCCSGDYMSFYAAWNHLLSEGALTQLLRTSIGEIQKPFHRRLTAIVSRDNLTPGLVEGRVVLDLGDDRFLLLPRELQNRSLLFTMRHGMSKVESNRYRVGRRLANQLDRTEGVAKADAVGRALAEMIGIAGHQLDFLNVPNYIDPKSFKHYVSSSPNTHQLFERIVRSIVKNQSFHTEPQVEPALESQDFGWATGVEKTRELSEAARIFNCDEKTAKKLIKNPLYCYPGGHSFFDFYIDVINGFHELARINEGEVACLYTHSSTLRALIIYLDPRPFKEAFTEFGEYKEKQDNVVLIASERGNLTGYSTAVGLSAREQEKRKIWASVEDERKGRITLKPGKLRQVVALVSGGDFAGAGAALKEIRVAGDRLGIDVYFVQHGYLGLANNWIRHVTEQDTRGMVSRASSPIGSSRFEEFKDERVQDIAYRNLEPYMDDGALIVIGGDGTFRGARSLFERRGVQVVGIPGTIDNNINGTTSLGFHSALSLANDSLESLKATSAAMGSIFFVEVMGAGSGHLALACGFQARAEGVLVNEHPDPDSYIDRAILGTLRRSLGVQNKSHLFIVAEKTPHRHNPKGGIHGLPEYVSDTISKWTHSNNNPEIYKLHVATKATILGHTLRGAPPSPIDKALGQLLAYEAIQMLYENPESVVGCYIASSKVGHIEPFPFHDVKPKPFDWQLFNRMHFQEFKYPA